MSKITPQSICIVRLSALGDVLMLLPLIRTLQHNLPKAKLTWVISEPAYQLVANIADIEFIVVKKNNNLVTYYEFAKKMYRRKFDVLLATQSSFRANLLYPFIKADKKIGYDALRAKDLHKFFINEKIEPGNDHTLDGFLKFASKLGINDKQIRWDIPLTKSDLEWAAKKLPRHNGVLLAINPAASKPERTWCVEKYIKIIKYAQEKYNATVILTGGPGEQDKLLEHEISKSVSIHSIVGKTKPAQLLAVLKMVDLIICPDTGPSHMASAVNTPVIALHAVTSNEVSGSYMFRHLAVDYYPKAVEKILKTKYGTQPWGEHAHGKDTMKLIPVEPVMKRIDEVLTAKSKT